jgi:hypothetical protein
VNWAHLSYIVALVVLAWLLPLAGLIGSYLKIYAAFRSATVSGEQPAEEEQHRKVHEDADISSCWNESFIYSLSLTNK